MKSSNKTAGFTLIELMITMVIVVLLLGGSLAAYLSFNRSQSMQNDARQVLSELNRARTMAASQQYPAGCISLNGVNVAGVAGGTDIKVTTQCEPQDSEKVTQVLTSSTFTASFDITFLPGSGYISDGADEGIIIQSGGSPPATKTIVVGTYGLTSIL